MDQSTRRTPACLLLLLPLLILPFAEGLPRRPRKCPTPACGFRQPWPPSSTATTLLKGSLSANGNGADCTAARTIRSKGRAGCLTGAAAAPRRMPASPLAFVASSRRRPEPAPRYVSSGIGATTTAAVEFGVEEATDEARRRRRRPPLRLDDTSTMPPSSPPPPMRSPSVHRVSLPSVDAALPPRHPIRSLWKWKDDALGDGRDYFVPRPRALTALNDLLVGTVIDVVVSAGSQKEMEAASSGAVAATKRIARRKREEGDQASVRIESIRCGSEHHDDGGDLNGIGRRSSSPMDEGAARRRREGGEGRGRRCSHHSFVVEECAALSNCARLDVLVSLRPLPPVHPPSLLLSGGEDGDEKGEAVAVTKEEEEEAKASRLAAKGAVAYHLLAQLASGKATGCNVHGRGSGRGGVNKLAALFDLPGVVDADAPTLHPPPIDTDVAPLASKLRHESGIANVTRHVAMVGCGLASRPSRPDRDVEFRPFSSRDAHVMLQLKRTAEVARGPRVKAILDAALTAGKAARDPKKVPEIEPLRQYGSTGRVPSGPAGAAAKAATKRAVEPAVESCRARLAAMDASAAVSDLRRAVGDDLRASMGIDLEDRGRSGDERSRRAREMLHGPCLDLREGRRVNVDALVEEIREEMLQMPPPS